MKTFKELQILLSDPLRYYLEIGHHIRPPFLEDPLEENIRIPTWQLKQTLRRLYTENLDHVAKSIHFQSPMEQAFVMEKMGHIDLQIKTQLQNFQINKSDVFNLHVVDHIQQASKKGINLFYPKKTLTGIIHCVCDKGILVMEKREKTFVKFLDLIATLLFAHATGYLACLKILFFDEKTFVLSKSEADLLLEQIELCIPHILIGKFPKTLSNNKDRYQLFLPLLQLNREEDCTAFAPLEKLLKEIYEQF